MTIDEEYLATIKQIVSVMRDKQRLLFITGAGISADSGLPTYRGIGGLYEDNLTVEGMSIEEALSGTTLRQRPEVTWKYLAQIEQSCRGATYNEAHRIIAEMEAHFDEIWVLTQNVDGFHSDAGSSNIIDIHGDLHYLSCMRCAYNMQVTDYSELEMPPRCPECGDMIRPDVVLFGEMLPEDKIFELFAELEQGFDMVFSIGTSSVFPYITQPVVQAKQRHIPTVEINPTESSVSRIVDYRVKAGAAESLTMLWHYFLPQ
jgi:NAD-dependent deacetylase